MLRGGSGRGCWRREEGALEQAGCQQREKVRWAQQRPRRGRSRTGLAALQGAQARTPRLGEVSCRAQRPRHPSPLSCPHVSQAELQATKAGHAIGGGPSVEAPCPGPSPPPSTAALLTPVPVALAPERRNEEPPPRPPATMYVCLLGAGCQPQSLKQPVSLEPLNSASREGLISSPFDSWGN